MPDTPGGEPARLPIEAMLRDVDYARRGCISDVLVNDLCYHVKALASEYERLRAEVVRLRAALEQIQCMAEDDLQRDGYWRGNMPQIEADARAALADWPAAEGETR